MPLIANGGGTIVSVSKISSQNGNKTTDLPNLMGLT